MNFPYFSKVLYLEDNDFYSHSILRFILAPCNFKQLDFVSNFEDALLKAENEVYDLAILDIELSSSSKTGFDLVGFLKAKSPKIKIIILSYYAYGNYLDQFNQLKLNAYLSKDGIKESFPIALEKIHHGEIFIAPLALKAWERYCREQKQIQINISHLKLSEREMEVINQVCEEKHAYEIAAKLNIETVTVKKHLSNIAKKIGVKGKVGIVNFAHKIGLFKNL